MENPENPQDEWLQAFNTNIRISFKELKSKDLTEPISAQREIVAKVFEEKNSGPWEKFHNLDQKTKDEVISTISETLIETRETLGMLLGFSFDLYDSPEEELDNHGTKRYDHADADFTTEEAEVRLNINSLNKLALLMNNPDSNLLVKDQIRASVAHEVAHIYISRTDLSAHARSLEANRVAKEDLAFEAYDNDEGEKFANQFASEYVLFKKGQLE